MEAPDPFSLEGKRILVTGASSGIGRQIAITCAQMGAQLVVSGRNAERLNSTLAELDGKGHTAVSADLIQEQDIIRVCEAAGVVNGVAHAAGTCKLVPYRMISRKQLEEQFSINVFAPMLLTKNLLSSKRIAANGSIVFISAVASHIGPVASATYSATKAALLGGMRTLGLEVAKQGIRANCLVPGYVRTPMLSALDQSGGSIGEHMKLTPLGLGEPEDVAYAAAFYLADASRWITRNYFVVDGGLTVPMDVYA